MTELTGVELARPGMWPISTGQKEFTAEDLRDAADFFTATGGQAIPVALGHNDERFTGEPSFGSVVNVTYEEDERGPVLKGDLVDMPGWLAAAAPKRWPNRSIEGFQDFEYDGRKYRLVLTGLALLGVAPPAVRNIKSLRDLQVALAASAAHRIVATAPAEPVAAASDPAMPYGDVMYADPGYQDDGKKRYPLDSEEHCRAAWSYINKPGNAAKYTSEQLAQIKARIRAALKKYGVKVAAEASPPEPPNTPDEAPVSAGASSSPPEGAGMSLAKYREALAGLPDNASEEDIAAALAAAGLSSSPPEPAKVPAPTATPPADPQPQPVEPSRQLAEVAAAAGAVVLDAGVWKQAQEQIAQGVQAAAKLREQERDMLLSAAVDDGRIPPANRAHWAALWDKDPKGTTQVIASLKRNLIPVNAMGYVGDDEDGPDPYAGLFPPEPTEPRRGVMSRG
jgi:hypothetical protein